MKSFILVHYVDYVSLNAPQESQLKKFLKMLEKFFMRLKNMEINLDYGKKGLNFIPSPNWNVEIIAPKIQEALSNPVESIENAIDNPIDSPTLGEIIHKKRRVEKVCIVVSDATRPVPSKLILEALTNRLNSLGVADENILVLVATGLHRGSTKEEHKIILGPSLYKRLRIIDHNSKDSESLKQCTASKHTYFINKFYSESDLKIITGYVEPHFFFGFSGGRKSIIPGIAGEESIRKNHSAEMIHSEFSRFGVYHENLMHKQAIAVAKEVGVDFAVNVCINEKHQVIKVVTGNFERAHEELVRYQLKKVFHPISNLYDIVICGNGGYPLDLNLYQAVKSMALGEMAIKKGGTIISVNECIEGVGIDQDKFKELLFSNMTPKEIYDKIMNKKITAIDQWEIQVLVRILQKAKIYVISKLKKDELGNIGLKHASSINEAIENSLHEYGSQARILVLPNGPQVLPLFTKKSEKKI
ncbi:MAG: nickel-dependent lactate racemase [Promethearchaeota archaeon]|nr:MAG: nickel-dependent lactate racemase [Candidatus Lokiarchaeota archaeon]